MFSDFINFFAGRSREFTGWSSPSRTSQQRSCVKTCHKSISGNLELPFYLRSLSECKRVCKSDIMLTGYFVRCFVSIIFVGSGTFTRYKVRCILCLKIRIGFIHVEHCTLLFLYKKWYACLIPKVMRDVCSIHIVRYMSVLLDKWQMLISS